MTTFSFSWSNAAAAGSQADAILQTLQAAGNRWAPLIQSSANITVSVSIGDVGGAIATGGSDFYSNSAGLYGPVAVSKVQTGADRNGSSPDINVTLSSSYISQLFYDPGQTGTVPSSAIDAVSVFQHELGHGLGINDISSSTYGQFVTTVGGQPSFTGANAEAAYGGPVPLDSTDSHVEKTDDLMYPSIPTGVRRTISDIDVGILQDIGMPIATDRADRITLGSADTSFMAMGGNDQVVAGDSASLLLGNRGDDTITAGNGADTLLGGFGNDSLVAGDGNNLLFGNEGSDTIQAGNGNNTLVGGQDSTDGADRIQSGSGRDLIFGNGGDDTVLAGGGDDSVVGGFGNDFLLGNQGNDLILGNQGQDVVFGGRGNDTIFAGQGDDTVYGNEGDDLLFGNEGRNTFVFNRGETDFQSGLRTGDVIADFKSGSDTIVFTQGVSATAQNFGTGSVSPSDFAGIQAAAQTLINAGDAYAFVTDGSKGYLFADENGDKAIDDAITLNGAATLTAVALRDIGTGAIA